MGITGIDRVVFGVEDMEKNHRFFTDWGLKEMSKEPDRIVFETLDGGEIVLRPADADDLAPAFEAGSTLREVVWGVADTAALEALRRRIGDTSEPSADQAPACTDPNGMRLSFRVSQQRTVDVTGSPSNTYDSIGRVDRRGTVYERATPVSVGHVVLFSPDVRDAVRFYEDKLGFVVSDCYPDAGYFLRCQPEGGHHNLFLLQTPARRTGLNHVAYTVRDIHEVFGGGLHIARCGWKTQLGPGRHPISSAYFWYVHAPCGGLAEYYADEDYCTAAWQAREFERGNANFAEWAIDGGIDPETRRQVEQS